MPILAWFDQGYVGSCHLKGCSIQANQGPAYEHQRDPTKTTHPVEMINGLLTRIFMRNRMFAVQQ
jgi:hypothetical protein